MLTSLELRSDYYFFNIYHHHTYDFFQIEDQEQTKKGEKKGQNKQKIDK